MHYDTIYNSKDFFWGLEADWIVHHTIKDHLKETSISNILDLGCWEWRNSFELAKKWFSIDAVDNSITGINKLNEYSKKNQLGIKTHVSDASTYLVNNEAAYDTVFCLNLFQSLSTDAVKQIIPLIQKNTQKWGLNIISCIIAENKAQKEAHIWKGWFVFEEWELKEYYTDWDICFYNEWYSAWRPHEKGSKEWYIVELIAKK